MLMLALLSACAHDRRTFGTVIDDTGIELAITRLLRTENEFQTGAHINATSLNGLVLLTGELRDSTQRDRLLEKVREISGVRRTVNEIRFTAPSTLSQRTHDAWLTSKVKTALARDARVDSSRIKVITEAKTVYLLGLLKRSEGQDATAAAQTVGGINRIVQLYEYVD